ncbi:Histone-lysine N-methyltransferase SETMAR, partial [Habropoda laboriosa]
KGVNLQYDNARPHVANVTSGKLKNLWEFPPHRPYSPDVAPSDYYLFKNLTNLLRGKNSTMTRQQTLQSINLVNT